MIDFARPAPDSGEPVPFEIARPFGIARRPRRAGRAHEGADRPQVGGGVAP